MVQTNNTIFAKTRKGENFRLLPRFKGNKETWTITGATVGVGMIIGISFLGLAFIFALLWLLAGWGFDKFGNMHKPK